MYQWLKADGSVLQTDTIKQFCEISGFCASSARTLAAGIRGRLNGWCSTAKRAEKQRDRFTTVLVNTKTGEKKWLGPTVKKFAREHGLCLNELSRLVNRRSRKYRGWVLQRTLDAIDSNAADSILEKSSTMPRLQSPDALAVPWRLKDEPYREP